jgi:hypothetical protein
MGAGRKWLNPTALYRSKMDDYFHQRRKLEFSVVKCANSSPDNTNLPELPTKTDDNLTATLPDDSPATI